MPISPGTIGSTGSSRPAASCAARPDDAIAQIEKFYEKQGEFGCFLQGAQLGRFRSDQEILRALCPLCRAIFPPAERQSRRLARLDLREHRGFQRAARPGGRGNVRQARRRRIRRQRRRSRMAREEPAVFAVSASNGRSASAAAPTGPVREIAPGPQCQPQYHFPAHRLTTGHAALDIASGAAK